MKIHRSRMINVTRSVSQGSILGPLYFWYTRMINLRVVVGNDLNAGISANNIAFIFMLSTQK